MVEQINPWRKLELDEPTLGITYRVNGVDVAQETERN